MRENTRTARRATTSHQAVFHDLTQYVTAALLVSELPDDDRLEPAVRDRFRLIHRQLTQMHVVLRDCLEGPDPRATADVVALVRECVDALEMRHHIDFVQDLRSAHLTGDHTALRRAVGNVLDNAVRAAADDDRIVVRVAGSDDVVCIEVRDTGVGFGRLGSGRGLGMLSVSEALGSFHGSLTITSGPGPGTLVRLQLPKDAA